MVICSNIGWKSVICSYLQFFSFYYYICKIDLSVLLGEKRDKYERKKNIISDLATDEKQIKWKKGKRNKF